MIDAAPAAPCIVASRAGHAHEPLDRACAAEEARRRRTQGQTGVRVGRKFQAVVPDWEGGEALNRNDELLSKAHMSCGEELLA